MDFDLSSLFNADTWGSGNNFYTQPLVDYSSGLLSGSGNYDWTSNPSLYNLDSLGGSDFLSSLSNIGNTDYSSFLNGGDLNLSSMLGSSSLFANSPTASTGTGASSGSSWLSKLGSGIFGSKLAPSVLTALAGGLLQGYSSTDQAELAKKKAQAEAAAKAAGATEYQEAVQSGKDEAQSEYVQSQAADRAALAQKISQKSAEGGGTNPRKTEERARRSQAESYGNFLLNLAQTTTPSLESYLAKNAGTAANYETPSFLSNTASGLASTLGTTAGVQAQMALLSSLLGNGGSNGGDSGGSLWDTISGWFS